MAELPDGTVDLYVHAEPDLFPRRGSDLELANSAKAAGLRAILHRHHFTSTVERGAVASAAAGFPVLGAIICNDSVGGLNPTAVEYALRTGAVWVGLPTLSAAHQRAGIDRFPPEARDILGFGPGSLQLLDDDGKILPAVNDIIALADQFDVPINLGYASFTECAAVVLAGRRSDKPFIATNPLTTMGWTIAQLDELLSVGMAIELTCYSMHPSGSYGGGSDAGERAVWLIRRAGLSRSYVSSDGGLPGAPVPSELLAWGLHLLAENGLSESEIESLSVDNPVQMLSI